MQARLTGGSPLAAYQNAARELVAALLNHTPAKPAGMPRILALHASNHDTSNTWALWGRSRSTWTAARSPRSACETARWRTAPAAPILTCLHFGERGECFYGGVMVEGVFPGHLRCDALVLLCPNYNDALSANLTAFINRLTALYRQTRFHDKKLFALIVSGYSGGDILACQLISALNMNKSFYLPPRFACWKAPTTRQHPPARGHPRPGAGFRAQYLA